MRAPGLIGRTGVLERIERELRAGTRLLTILGPPGIGKTSVATASLRHLVETRHFSGNCHFCDLAQARTEDELLFAVLSLFRDQQRPAHLVRAEVKARLAETLAALGPALLVLDNFEQLAFASETVAAWSRAAPALAIVVTSRERLAVSGEVVIELPPLASPEAVQLFVTRAQAAGGDAGSDAAALADIVRRLDGIPLAIELAAARTRLLGVSELARRLDAGHDVLGASRGDTRHATLAKAIDGSWNLLSAEEQRTLARCSVFAGSFTLEAAERVAGASMDVVGALRDKSLVHAAGEGRLALYASIREYAAKKLALLGEDPLSAPLGHARCYAGAARRFNETRSLQSNEAQPELHGSLRREQDNLTTALAFVRQHKTELASAQLQRDLAIAVASLHALPGDACIDALTAALAALRSEGDEAGAASVLLARQLVWSALGHHDECLRDLAELRNSREAPSDLRILALVYRGIQERYQGDARRALASHEEAARELEAVDLRRARAMNDACTGRLHCDLRNEAEARVLNGRAFDAADALGDLWLSALALANLAQLEHDEGRLDRAEELIETALTRLKTAGEAHYAAIYASACGDLAFERGKPDVARRSYAEGARYFGSLLAHRQAGILHAAAAALEATEGDLTLANAHLEVARTSAARSGNPIVRHVVDAHRGTVELLRAEGAERASAIATWRAWRDACARESTTGGALASESMDLRFALRMLDRTLQRVAPEAPTTGALRLALDGSWFVAPSGERVDLGRRAALRRILVALCEEHAKRTGTGLATEALVAIGWPGERVLVEAAATRVRVAVSTLRSLGLKAVLLTRDDGYLLDPQIRVEQGD